MRKLRTNRLSSLLRPAPLLGLTAAVAAIAMSADAHAVQVFASDCNFGFQDVYNPGDGVCVSGEMDIVPPGKICAEGYVVVIPANNANAFADVTMGGANYIMGCAGAGAFFDEYVWLPPLKPGQYELVVDQYPFLGAFGAEDYRTFGTAFTVSNAPIVFSVDPNAIKNAAKEGLKEAAAIKDLVLYLSIIDTLSTAVDWTAAFGKIGGAAAIALGVYCYKANKDCPTSYDSAVITIGNKILTGIAESLEAKYGTLIADPPDPNFADVVPLVHSDLLATGGPWTPLASHPVAKGQTSLATLLAVQTAGYQALVPTLEKLQGAQIAGDNLGVYRQAAKLEQYVSLIAAAGDAMKLTVDAMEVAFSAAGVLDSSADTAQIKGILDGIAANGFSEQEENALLSFGLTDVQIVQAKADLATLPELPTTLAPRALLDSTRKMVDVMKPALADLAGQAQKMKDENAPYAFDPGPGVQIAGPATGKVGTAVMLSASATHFDPTAGLTYAWDSDLDGAFDDGSAATLSFTARAPGRTLVSVRVTDSSGNADVAHAAIDVAVANEPPELTSTSPLDPAPFADVGEVVAFKAEATDPDGDPLALKWSVDGTEQGSGQEFLFEMPDDLPHDVEIVVSDDDPYSPDARSHYVVRAGKWKGNVGTGGSGTGGNDTGGGGGGGNNAGGNGTGADGAGGNNTGGNGTGAGKGSDGGSGCGCRVDGGSEDAGGAGALVLFGLAGLRRLARRRSAKTR